MNLGTV